VGILIRTVEKGLLTFASLKHAQQSLAWPAIIGYANNGNNGTDGLFQHNWGF